MLTCTFRHFKGIGAKTERELWRSGVCTWEAFEAKHAVQLSMFDFSDADDAIVNCLMILGFSRTFHTYKRASSA